MFKSFLGTGRNGSFVAGERITRSRQVSVISALFTETIFPMCTFPICTFPMFPTTHHCWVPGELVQLLQRRRRVGYESGADGLLAAQRLHARPQLASRLVGVLTAARQDA